MPMTFIVRKVWGDLTHNKARTLLVVLSIAAGVFAVGLAFGALGVLRAIGTTATGIIEVFCGEGILPRSISITRSPGYTLAGDRVGAFGVG